MDSTRSDKGTRVAAETPQLQAVRLLWLPVSENEKYLLLEDEETGDVLLPLIYMKSVFEANYSRKLSSLKHRLVVFPNSEIHGGAEVGNKRKPSSYELDSNRGFVYWQWAFESPHEVKVLVRQALGDPQGHLRLILLPIVYNAMSQKLKLRSTPFFHVLHRALRASTYSELLRLPPEVEAELAVLEKSSLNLSLGSSDNLGDNHCGKVFNGPHNFQKTIAKYTLSYEAAEDSDISKRRYIPNLQQKDTSHAQQTVNAPLNSSTLRCISLDEEQTEAAIELEKQNAEIINELTNLRKRHSKTMQNLLNELQSFQEMITKVVWSSSHSGQ